MTHFLSVWEGFVVMVACFIISAAIALFCGAIVDIADDAFNDADVYENAEGVWAEEVGQIRFFENLIYAVPYIISGLGILVFAVSVYERQEYDVIRR